MGAPQQDSQRVSSDGRFTTAGFLCLQFNSKHIMYFLKIFTCHFPWRLLLFCSLANKILENFQLGLSTVLSRCISVARALTVRLRAVQVLAWVQVASRPWRLCSPGGLAVRLPMPSLSKCIDCGITVRSQNFNSETG